MEPFTLVAVMLWVLANKQNDLVAKCFLCTTIKIGVQKINTGLRGTSCPWNWDGGS